MSLLSVQTQLGQLIYLYHFEIGQCIFRFIFPCRGSLFVVICICFLITVCPNQYVLDMHLIQRLSYLFVNGRLESLSISDCLHFVFVFSLFWWTQFFPHRLHMESTSMSLSCHADVLASALVWVSCTIPCSGMWCVYMSVSVCI